MQRPTLSPETFSPDVIASTLGRATNWFQTASPSQAAKWTLLIGAALYFSRGRFPAGWPDQLLGERCSHPARRRLAHLQRSDALPRLLSGPGPHRLFADCARHEIDQCHAPKHRGRQRDLWRCCRDLVLVPLPSSNAIRSRGAHHCLAHSYGDFRITPWIAHAAS